MSNHNTIREQSNYLTLHKHDRRLLSIHLQSFMPKLVAFLTIVFVFEEAFYGRLELGVRPYMFAKTASEAFLYFFFLLIISYQLIKGRLHLYQPTLFDFCIIGFLFLAVISTIINHGSLILGALNVRTMLRYMAIYYIIVLTGWMPTEQQMMKFFKLLIGIAVLQSFLIILQHFLGDGFRDAFFSPRRIELAIAGTSKVIGAMTQKIGAGYGTFGKTPLAAFYLLFVAVITVALALTSHPSKRKKLWLLYVLLVIGIFFTYKRAPLLLAVIAPVVMAKILGRKSLLKKYLMLGLIFVPIAVILLIMIRPEQRVREKKVAISPGESLSQFFLEDYWSTVFSVQRGWMIKEVGRDALLSFNPIGYGADEERAKAMLATKKGEFAKLAGWGAFDDVYFVANLVYYGYLGIIMLLAAFFYIYRRGKMLARLPNLALKISGLSLATIIILMFLSVFVVRLFEFRAFIFLFWFLAGITVVAYRRTSRFKIKYAMIRPSSEEDIRIA